MSKILFLTNVIRRMGMMQQTVERLQREQKVSNDCACHWITDKTIWDKKWEENLRTTDVVLLKWMGSGLDTPFLKKLVQFLDARKIPYYIDAAGTNEGELKFGFTPEQLATLKKYTSFGGERNSYNLWQYLDQCLEGGDKEIEAPDPIHWCGIYHPRAKKVYTDLAEYQADFCDASKPTIGMLFYRDEWVWGDLTYQSATVEEIEAQGMNAICVFSNGMPIEEMGMPSLTKVFDGFFCKDGVPAIDALINVMKFSLSSSGTITVDYFKKWNVPILAGYTIMTDYDEWKESFEGMNPMEVSIAISLPEFDGTIHGVPISYKKVLENGDVRYLPIMERVQRMVSKA
ncbi:MAG: cobaltochelatase subunit CobN, partial [Phascolarctobacterium sp.]|nr:cobaltochelatase subunit CobN [Phascolarctobacterium sp.]